MEKYSAQALTLTSEFCNFLQDLQQAQVRALLSHLQVEDRCELNDQKVFRKSPCCSTFEAWKIYIKMVFLYQRGVGLSLRLGSVIKISLRKWWRKLILSGTNPRIAWNESMCQSKFRRCRSPSLPPPSLPAFLAGWLISRSARFLRLDPDYKSSPLRLSVSRHRHRQSVREQLQYLSLSKSWHCQRGGGGSDPCQDFSGWFDIANRCQPKVIMALPKWQLLLYPSKYYSPPISGHSPSII